MIKRFSSREKCYRLINKLNDLMKNRQAESIEHSSPLQVYNIKNPSIAFVEYYSIQGLPSLDTLRVCLIGQEKDISSFLEDIGTYEKRKILP